MICINILHNKPVIKRHNTFRFYLFIKIFDDKNMKDTKLKHNKAFRLNYQQMLKKRKQINNLHNESVIKRQFDFI